MPKPVTERTRDKKPTKEMLIQILDHANIKYRAIILFLVSSGARIGETLQLKKQDLMLDSKPPKAIIRAEYTKGGVGARTVYFSYEARDAIKEWLKIKASTKKRTGESFEGDLVFPWNSYTARFMFNLSCDKSGINNLDHQTNRRVIHIQSLRKFFRSNSGLGADIVHALMGTTNTLTLLI
jgi:integrase